MRHLGIDPHLDRRTLRPQTPSTREHILAYRLTDHPFDEVDAEDSFRDGMLDLEAGIDLEEIEFLALGIVDELDGA